MTDYYLHADKTASTTLPGSDDSASTSFKYDPANPAPTMGGNNLPDRYESSPAFKNVQNSSPYALP